MTRQRHPDENQDLTIIHKDPESRLDFVGDEADKFRMTENHDLRP